MKRKTFASDGDTARPVAKRPRTGSTRYPGLRAPPQRKPRSKAFSTAVKVGSSRFERLPPEIRNYVYELVLVDKTAPLKVRHQHLFDRGMTAHALTQVSRSTRAECVQMYYSANTFAFRSLQDVRLYLATIGPDSQFVEKVHLGEGVIEGRHYPYGTREEANRPRTRIDFTYRISSTSPPALTTASAIHPESLALAEQRLDRIGKLTAGRAPGRQDLVIEGTVAHCPLCATGWQWSCGLRAWWES